MTDLQLISITINKYLPELKSKYRIKTIGLFGSYVRGEQNKDSDIDILVEYQENTKTTIFTFLDLKEDLSVLLGKEVDLVTKKALKTYIARNVLNEVIYF